MPRGVKLTAKQRAEIVRKCDEEWTRGKRAIGADYGVTRSAVEKIYQMARRHDG